MTDADAANSRPLRGPAPGRRQSSLSPYAAPFTCGTPDEFLFWDGIHPSAAVQAIIAQEAATVLMQ